MTHATATSTAERALAAWDVGGAHLKLALLAHDGTTLAVEQWPAPAWLGVSRLEQALDSAARMLHGHAPLHVVTMTAELADCFTDRAAGVRQVVTLLEARLAPAPIHYYSARGLLTAVAVGADPLCVASVQLARHADIHRRAHAGRHTDRRRRHHHRPAAI